MGRTEVSEADLAQYERLVPILEWLEQRFPRKRNDSTFLQLLDVIGVVGGISVLLYFWRVSQASTIFQYLSIVPIITAICFLSPLRRAMGYLVFRLRHSIPAIRRVEAVRHSDVPAYQPRSVGSPDMAVNHDESFQHTVKPAEVSEQVQVLKGKR